jgi:hypothetical protein
MLRDQCGNGWEFEFFNHAFYGRGTPQEGKNCGDIIPVAEPKLAIAILAIKQELCQSAFYIPLQRSM